MKSGIYIYSLCVGIENCNAFCLAMAEGWHTESKLQRISVYFIWLQNSFYRTLMLIQTWDFLALKKKEAHIRLCIQRNRLLITLWNIEICHRKEMWKKPEIPLQAEESKFYWSWVSTQNFKKGGTFRGNATKDHRLLGLHTNASLELLGKGNHYYF